MLIYKGMNVFPTAIRDLSCERFAGRVRAAAAYLEGPPGPGALRRADRRSSRSGAGARAPRSRGAGARDRGAVRPQLQVRVAVTVLPPRRAAARRLQECAGRRARRSPGKGTAMKFERAALSARHLWSSPFVRWQGSLADVSSLDVARGRHARRAGAARDRPAGVTQLVLGTTIPQPRSSTPRPGSPRASACRASPGRTSPRRAPRRWPASSRPPAVEATATRARSWSRPTAPATGRCWCIRARAAPGGSPATENWVLDNFAADPWTSQSMVATAEAVARRGRHVASRRSTSSRCCATSSTSARWKTTARIQRA